MIVAFASQRGGVGKSTLCVTTAAQWAAASPCPAPLQVLDLDPQKVALGYERSLGEVGVSVTFPDWGEVPRIAKTFPREGALLLDTPPGIGEEIALAVQVADVIVVPITSKPSFTGARDLHVTVKQVQAERPGLRVFYVLTMQMHSTRHARAVQGDARGALGALVLEPMISHSVVWDEAMGENELIGTWAPGHPAIREAQEVSEELRRRIYGTNR